MKEIKLECFEEFHKKVQSYNKNTDIYRGVIDKDYQLVPKIGWIALKKIDLVAKKKDASSADSKKEHCHTLILFQEMTGIGLHLHNITACQRDC